jgi:RNA polymerase sigma-70 factor (ECF subfamily)
MQRAAVILFYLEDQPIAEVAQILECSKNTASVHLHRARKRLARSLGVAPDEEGVAEGVA